MEKYRVIHTGSGHTYKGGLKNLQEAKAYINRNRETLKKYLPKKSWVIVNPYFIPDEEMMNLFQTLRNEGVEISILTNSLESTDGKWVYAYYAPKQKALLKMGVKGRERVLKYFKQEDQTKLLIEFYKEVLGA